MRAHICCFTSLVVVASPIGQYPRLLHASAAVRLFSATSGFFWLFKDVFSRNEQAAAFKSFVTHKVWKILVVEIFVIIGDVFVSR